MHSNEIRIEIKPGQHKSGGWWAYIIQEVEGERRVVGRAFRTNPEAWQWAQDFTDRLCSRKRAEGFEGIMKLDIRL